MNAMGVPVVHRPIPSTDQAYETILTPPSPLDLTSLHMTIPGDISAAAFLIVAALTTPGSQVTFPEVGLNPTRTGLLDALKQMGADLQIRDPRQLHGEPVGDLTVRYSHLQGTQVSGGLVVRMIDEFPAFAIAAAHAQGQCLTLRGHALGAEGAQERLEHAEQQQGGVAYQDVYRPPLRCLASLEHRM